MYYSFERIILTLWIGSMWTVGYLVVPVLFSQLEDRALAGMLAGQMFTIVSYIGLVAGSLLLVREMIKYGRPSRQHWHSVVLIIMLVFIMIGEYVLQPQMAELKAAGLEGEVAELFGRLHGIASVLYLVNSIFGLVLITRWNRE